MPSSARFCCLGGTGTSGRCGHRPLRYAFRARCPFPNPLIVQVDGVLGVALDELLAGLHLLPHEDGEGLVGPDSVVQLDALEGREMSTLALGLSPRSSAEMASRSSSEKARRVVLPRLSLNRGGTAA